VSKHICEINNDTKMSCVTVRYLESIIEIIRNLLNS
jgi:hypothetical protein